MNTYDVQVSRVVKLTFVNIEASSAQEAALLADGRAKGITDCIVRSDIGIAGVGMGAAPSGTLISVRDADMNTEVLVERVHCGVALRDARFVRSERLTLEHTSVESVS